MDKRIAARTLEDFYSLPPAEQQRIHDAMSADLDRERSARRPLQPQSIEPSVHPFNVRSEVRPSV